FLNAQPIRYALTVNPTIYISCIKQFWSTGVVKTINGEVQLHALLDGKKIIISEASVRRDLKLEDEEDEVVHKESGDSLVKAATTTSSLEAEQDGDGGPRCQETMGDTIAQTRFENVSKLSNDSLLVRARVESSRDEESLGEDVSKQERINAIDADDDITLVNVQKVDEEMFDMDALDVEEVFIAEQNENVVEEVVDAAQVSIAATNVTITNEEMTLAQALATLKTSKPKVKEIAFQEPSTTTTTISSQQSQDNGKGIMIAEPVKPMKKKSFHEVNTSVDIRTDMVEGSSNRAREELEQESAKNQMLKSFDREDLEDLYKLVKARYGSTRPVESMDYLLWNDLKIMFEPHVEDANYGEESNKDYKC
ncbi:hypothetical protein Tco_0832168, partial [Tanacetum coccineum]